MKRRIIIFNGIDTFLYLYLRIKFFHNLSFQGFLRRFSCFDFTTREFPHSLKFTIATCRSKHFIIFTNHRSYYPYCFHLSVFLHNPSISLFHLFSHSIFSAINIIATLFTFFHVLKYIHSRFFYVST